MRSSKQLKIGFPYVGDRFGGSNMSSLVMAGGLQALGHDVVVATHGGGRAADEAAARGLRTVALPALSTAPGYSRPDKARWDNILALRHCARFMREQQLDIIHTNDLTMLRTWALPAVATGKTLVAHWRTSSRASLSVSAALWNARRIISVSDYSKDILPSWAQRRTIVEFNALESFWNDEQRAIARKAIRQELGFPEDSLLLGVFGNLTKRKRAHALADIMRDLGPSIGGRPVFGVACGGVIEPRDEELEPKREAYGLKERLAVPGFVRPVDRWMAACDVILAPAEREPLARNVLEAMAVGVPVVVSDDGGLREFIKQGDNGFLLAPHDTDQWVRVIRDILSGQCPAEQLIRAGQKAASELTVEKHARRIEKIYFDALTRKA